MAWNISDKYWKHPLPPHGMFMIKMEPNAACPLGCSIWFNDKRISWHTAPIEAIAAVNEGKYNDEIGFNATDGCLPSDLDSWWINSSRGKR